MKLSFGRDNIVRFSSRVKTASPDALRALEQAWLKRQQELGGWRPSRGWLIEPKLGRPATHS
jgi:hypothetical protein